MKFLFFIKTLVFFLSLCPVLAQEKHIFISQTAVHKSLDEVRKGIEDEIRSHSELKVIIHYDNAMGNNYQAYYIAKKILSKNPDIAVGIGTLSSQTLAKVNKARIPLVFSVVTDPVRSHLCLSLNKPLPNITGVTSILNLDVFFNKVKFIFPKVRTVGVLFHPSESNSHAILIELQKSSRANGIKLLSKGVLNSSELKLVLPKFLNGLDGLILIQDHFTASHLSLILKEAKSRSIPILSLYKEAMSHGADFGFAAPEYDIGRQTGRQIISILKGKSVSAIPIESPNKVEFLIKGEQKR